MIFDHGAAPMTVATIATARLTSDPVAPAQLRADIAKLFDALRQRRLWHRAARCGLCGGRHNAGGIRRIFETKRRSYDKPSGMFGNWRMSREIHLMDETRHAMVREIVEQERIPFSVVAPFRADHPLFASSRSVRDEELIQGRHAGHAAQRRPVSRCYRRRAVARGTAVFGSSANLSLSGSKYRYQDIEPAILRRRSSFF